MTTFEITITTLLALIAFALIFRDFVIGKALDQIIKNQESQYKKLDFIKTQIAGAREDMYDDVGNHYLVEILNKLDNIESKNDQGFKELTNIVDKMHRNLCVEIADKMVDRVYKQPTSVNETPCYAPDGICTNPCRDCINCPKRGTGGSWSTSTNTIKED